jgi:hypothetical protein
MNCGSDLPICAAYLVFEKRRRAGAVQDADALFVTPNPLDGHRIILTPLVLRYEF